MHVSEWTWFFSMLCPFLVVATVFAVIANVALRSKLDAARDHLGTDEDEKERPNDSDMKLRRMLNPGDLPFYSTTICVVAIIGGVVIAFFYAGS